MTVTGLVSVKPPFIKSPILAWIVIALCGVGSVLSLVLPLPVDIDKFRVCGAWFPARGLFTSAGLLTVLSALFITFMLSPFLGGHRIGNLEIPAIPNAFARRTVAAIGWIGITLLLFDSVGFPGMHCRWLPKTSTLLSIEKKNASNAVFKPAVEPTASSVPDRYLRANASFLGSLTHGDTTKALLVVTAPGGFGKSFLMNELRQRLGDRFKLYKLTSFGGEWTTADLIVRQDNNSVTLNSLLRLSQARQDEVLDRIRRNLQDVVDPIIVVDDFDEIDPVIARAILGQLSALAEQAPKPCRILAVGRPEAFASYLNDPHRPFQIAPTWIALKPPIYSTKGDIQSLLQFIYTDSGRELTQEQKGKFFNFVNRNDYLLTMLGNLSHAIDVVKYVRDEPDETLTRKSEEEIKEIFCGAILQRNSLTHKRPSPNEPQHLAMYVALIEAIAAMTSNTVAVDGSFRVSALENVSRERVSAQIQNVLNRSGLVEVEPLDTLTLRYRFTPFWLHRYFVNQYNKSFGGASVVRVVGVTLFLGGIVVSIWRSEKLARSLKRWIRGRRGSPTDGAAASAAGVSP